MALRFWFAVAVLGVTACASPRTPSSEDDSDAGLSCEERARARDLCLNAYGSRCHAQQSDCEVFCDQQGNGDLPANTNKAPTERGDIESTRCREHCRLTYDQCVRSIAPRCPGTCSP